jgi:transcriptional regulator with GAF, ATPase, and Fis domain
MMLSREARIGQLFVELADTLIDDFDVVELLHRLAEACTEVLEVDAAGLMLTDLRGGLRLVAWCPDAMKRLEVFELQTDEGPSLDAIRTGQAVVNVDVTEARQRWPRFTAAALAADIRSAHALPLRLRGQLIGVMNLFSTEQQRMSQNDIALGQALADVATIGLLQQRAIRDQSIVAEQLHAALNTRIVLEQAKGMLAELSGLSPAETFRYLRQHARRTGQSLQAVAQQVIDGQLDSTELIPNSR